MTVHDVHTHIWDSHPDDERVLLEAIERYAIERIYVSTIEKYAPDADDVRRYNARTAAFARAQPSCVSGYVYVSPELPDAMDTLRRGIEEQGLIGVKFWVSSYCDAPCVNPLVERIIDYGVPLLVHSFHKANGQVPNETVGRNVAALARRYPEVKIIMAHFGGNCYNGIPAIRDCDNVWCDYCGSIFRGDEMNYALEYLGAERILFGTDMPGSFVVNFGQVLEADISDAGRDLILCGNAKRLFDRNYRRRGATFS